MYAMHIQKSTMQDNFRFAIQNFVFRAKVYIPKNYKHLKEESRIEFCEFSNKSRTYLDPQNLESEENNL